jgi:hypothetical protein
LNAMNKRLERQLRLRAKDAEDAVVRGDGLELSMASLQGKFDAKCVEFNDLKARYRTADNELTRVQADLAAKCVEVEQFTSRLTNWKSHADKRQREKVAKIEKLTAERNQLHQDQEAERKSMTNANKILEAKYLVEKREVAARQLELSTFKSQFAILQEDRQDIAGKLDIEEERVEELCCIRHMDQR